MTSKNDIEQLESGGRRTRVHDAYVGIKLPSGVRDLVKEIATKEGVSDSAIYRAAVAEYLRRRGYSR